MRVNSLWLGMAAFVALVHARPELVLHDDIRKLVQVAEFGFVSGGKLGLHCQGLQSKTE